MVMKVFPVNRKLLKLILMKVVNFFYFILEYKYQYWL